jgi:hypothetical protein
MTASCRTGRFDVSIPVGADGPLQFWQRQFDAGAVQLGRLLKLQSGSQHERVAKVGLARRVFEFHGTAKDPAGLHEDAPVFTQQVLDSQNQSQVAERELIVLSAGPFDGPCIPAKNATQITPGFTLVAVFEEPA